MGHPDVMFLVRAEVKRRCPEGGFVTIERDDHRIVFAPNQGDAEEKVKALFRDAYQSDRLVFTFTTTEALK